MINSPYLISMKAMSFSHRLVIKYVPIIFIFWISASNAAPTCPGNSITIQDSVTGEVQCQDCLKCPAGQGLSVHCGDVISPQTPIVCKPCKLGETYSSKNEAGACRSCENCEEYRETIEVCKLTSKAVCGKCKPGAYLDDLIGICKPCSHCCNDRDDIIVPECQVPGVPKNKQCSVLRSEKCRKVAANVNTRVFPVDKNNFTSPESTPTMIEVSTPVTMHPARQLASTAYGSSSNGALIGVGVGVPLVLILVLLAAICHFMKIKRKQQGVCKKKDDVENEAAREREEPGDSDGSSVDAEELNSGKPILQKLSVEESDPISPGITETQPPADYHSNTGKLLALVMSINLSRLTL